MAQVLDTTSRPTILDRIDTLEASERMKRLRDRYFREAPVACGDRMRLAVESLKQTEGQDSELRRAKMLAHILNGIPVVIHDDELTGGSQTKHFRGAYPYIDWDAEYFKDIAEMGGEAGTVTFGSPALHGSIAPEDWDALVAAAAYFKGKTPGEAMREAAKAVLGDWYQDAIAVCASSPGYDSFPYLPGVPLFEEVIAKGLRSVIAEAKGRIERMAETQEHDPQKLYFWQAAVIACEGVIDLAHRYADKAREMALQETDEHRRQELEEIARACEWVPENPARTLQEAIQAFRLAHLALLLENGRHGPSMGRVDQYLYPYFQRDLAEGRLTLEQAADLLGDLLSYAARLEAIYGHSLKECVQSTMIVNVTLGGVTRDDADATNELSYLFLHVAGLVKYSEPHLTVRLHTGKTPHWLLRKGLEMNRITPGIPMYSNDRHVTECLVNWGVKPEEARDWVMNGCSNAVARPMRHYSPYQFNTPLTLDLALHDGIAPLSGKRIGPATGDPRSFTSFEQMYQAWQKQDEFVLRRLLYLQRIFHRVQLNAWRTPLNSALQPGCIENGRDVLDGGNGEYPGWLMKDRGMVDVADSLTAVKKLVFEDRTLTMAELIQALDSNFEGERAADIQRMCLSAPKYGNDLDEPDLMVRDVAKFSASVIRSENNVYGAKYAISRNGVSWHYAAGKGVGSLPNGRKIGEPLYDGSLSPMRGMDKRGPTALLNSAVKADYKESAQSILNQKFPLSMVQSAESLEKLALLAEVFFENGGSHVQFNFLDRKVLLEAKQHPEQYRDLIVRVAGYSAYFVNLTADVQDDIIRRTEQFV